MKTGKHAIFQSSIFVCFFFGWTYSSARGQIHWHPSRNSHWRWTPPPTALVQQFSASSAAPQKKVPSLQHCFLSDGCFDVQFLQRQVTAWECSLWRTSTTLKLIHGVGESLSVSKKAHAAVATGIEQNWCQDVFMAAKSLWIRNCRSSNPTSASGGIFTWIIISCWMTLPCERSFGCGFEYLISIIWNSYSG